MLDWFHGWLEFAGRDVRGVDWCPEWPVAFKIESGCCALCVIRDDIEHFCVTAETWPSPAHFAIWQLWHGPFVVTDVSAGFEWMPRFYRHELDESTSGLYPIFGELKIARAQF